MRTTFGLFCFAWAALAIAVTRLQLLDMQILEPCWGSGYAAEATRGPIPVAPLAQRWAHVPATFAFVAGFFAMLHVLALSGRDERLDERIGPIRLRQYVIIFAGLTLAGALLSLGTNLVVVGATYHRVFGAAVILAPTAVLVQVPYGLAVLVWIVLLRRARREVRSAAERAFVHRSLFGFYVLLGDAAVGTVLLPSFGFPVFGVLHDASLVIAVYLGWNLIRHRVGRAEELAQELERRISERTHDLKLAQTRLFQSEKLASLGALVAGAADQMNAPLGAVRAMHDTRSRSAGRLMQRVQELLGEVATTDKTLVRSRAVLLQGDQVIRDGIDNIDRFVQRLRSYAKLDHAKPRLVDVNAALEDALLLMTTRLGRVRVVRRYGEVPSITCLARRIDQVFFAALSNAIDAISEVGSEEGTLGVTTEHSGDMVVVHISDDGAGISGENLPLIFEPGFTTKDAGLGLGLALCSQIVHEHAGEIAVESCPGVGTVIKIALPIEARLIVR